MSVSIDGTNCTSMGSRTLVSQTDGESNVVLGARACPGLTIGSGHVILGYSACALTNTATNNTIVGYGGNLLTTGSYNTLLGFGAEVSSAADSNCIVLAASSVPGNNTSNGTNTITIGLGAAPISSNTATAGTASALPTNIFRYLKVKISGTDYKIPTYLA